MPQFVCLRLFLTPIESHLFAKPASQAEKLGWLRKSFLKSINHKSPKGGNFALRVKPERDFVFSGKLARRQVFSIHERTPDDVSDREVENWPYVVFRADLSPERQVFVVEENSAVFRSIDVLTRVLTEMATDAVFVHGYAASFEPIVQEQSFWQLVEKESQGVFAVTFRLRSPNLFGGALKANETLKQLQAAFNNTEADISLRNDKGQLRLPRERVESFREYADKGGGSWELTYAPKGKSKRRRKTKSSTRALRIAIDVEGDQTAQDAVKAALIRFIEHL